MFRNFRTRRRPRYGAQVCAVIASVLLLLSVSLLHSRLSFSHSQRYHSSNDGISRSNPDPLLDDPDPEYRNFDDRIDELDDVVLEDKNSNSNDEEILAGRESEDEETDQSRVSNGFYYDHVNGVVRRAVNKRNIDQWEDYASFDSELGLRFGNEDKSKNAFGSDDIPVDENVRAKMGEVKGIEDLLLLKTVTRISSLREGWGEWFDKKSDFLRRDRMFKSYLELLNPMNNPLLQDPDGVGVTGLTRGDKLVQKGIFNDFHKVPFLGKKPLGLVDSIQGSKLEDKVEDLDNLVEKVGVTGHVNLEDKRIGGVDDGRSEMRRVERRTLNNNAGNNNSSRHLYNKSMIGSNESFNLIEFKNLSAKTNISEDIEKQNEGSNKKVFNLSTGEVGRLKSVKDNAQGTNEFSDQLYADGRRWGYFPGLNHRLSFSNFMDSFFRKGRCSVRFFMVWNSPPWMFSVRHQRGLESVLFHHQDACVVVFSETIELNFFNGFVMDGFKVAVVMPNLDELLKDTPTHIFASVWFEWKKTKYYSTHYSELVRLAALYKYGGIYLDFDIIVLKSLSSLNNIVCREDELAGSPLNGAVMSFKKHSPFIMECLTEFYSTYDDNQLRWNGADLLTRVTRKFSIKEIFYDRQINLELKPSFLFFPITHNNITRYFMSPRTDTERAEQDVLFGNILNQSFAFHFWDSLTSSLVPETDSLASRLINHPCIRCSDVL